MNRIPPIRKKSDPVFYLMVLPALILVGVYAYIPLSGLAIAFQSYEISSGLFGSPWVGFDNFEFLFMLDDFWNSVWNTFFISIMKVILAVVVPVSVAILLNEMRSSKIQGAIQTAIYLPYFISWVVVAGMLREILAPDDGLLNSIIASTGGESIPFLAEESIFPWILIFSDVWKEFGFGTIMYLAALVAIDPSLYESASIDGASRWEKIKSITLPSIAPVIVLIATLKLGTIFNIGFDQVFNLYSPLVYSTGDILDTFVFRLAFQGASGGGSGMPQYELATAVGLFKSAISFVLVAISYRVAYKLADYRIF